MTSPPPKSKAGKLSTLSRERSDWKDGDHYWNALENESDRGVVLIVAAELEQTLEDAISRRFIALSDSERDDLFSSMRNAPISSFGSKIRIGYALGIFGKITRDDLLKIAQIRNVFAHSSNNLNFENPIVRAACCAFLSASAYRKAGIEEIFPASGANDPRHNYIVTAITIAGTLNLQILARHRSKNSHYFSIP